MRVRLVILLLFTKFKIWSIYYFNELRDEMHRRKAGLIPNVSSPSSHYTNPEPASHATDNNNPSSSNNKRKFEEDSESNVQPKDFKQDTSDITGDTEPFDFLGGDD